MRVVSPYPRSLDAAPLPPALAAVKRARPIRAHATYAQLDSHEFIVASLTGSPVRRIAISGLPKDDESQIYGLDWTPRPLPSR